jgi:mRNA interferase RelE/StbE
MIDMTNTARKFLSDLPAKQFKQVGQKIFSLLKEPLPTDAKHLSGHPGFRRVDSGKYRICYQYANKVVKVVVVGNRNDDAIDRQLDRVNG